MDHAKPPQGQICACIEYIEATPFAWPKTDTVKDQIRNLTNYKEWMEQRMRVDYCATILQLIPQSTDVICTIALLKQINIVWMMSENAIRNALWWETVPVFERSVVMCRLKEGDGEEDYRVDAHGDKVLQGALGVWMVGEDGEGLTTVAGIPIAFNTKYLAAHPGLIMFS